MLIFMFHISSTLSGSVRQQNEHHCYCSVVVGFLDDVIKWKYFPRYWPFVRGIHRWPVNSPHKGQWRGALMFSLVCALNKRLSKQSWGWWFETPSCSLWRHRNEKVSKIDQPRDMTWSVIECFLGMLAFYFSEHYQIRFPKRCLFCMVNGFMRIFKVSQVLEISTLSVSENICVEKLI